jgi:hypothetical protein
MKAIELGAEPQTADWFGCQQRKKEKGLEIAYPDFEQKDGAEQEPFAGIESI